jgi:hypothetical protein
VNDPDHKLIYWDELTDHTGVILILLALVLFSNIVILIVRKCIRIYGSDADEPEDELIPPYWNSLNGEV